jgi:hypothetical protein
MTLLLYLCVTQVGYAETRTFSASVTPISATRIEQVTGLNFGQIANQSGAACTINSDNSLSGACISEEVSASAGEITVSGLGQNQSITVRIDGSTDGFLDFVPQANINDTNNFLGSVNNGEIQTVITSSNGDNINLIVFGDLTLLNPLPLNEERTISYSITIEIE